MKRALGVTRIARVTGLDRTGVEVAAAIRPMGHVLQVCNGKGETFEEAATGALMEAAELAYSERVEPTALVWGSEDELARSGRRAWGPGEVGSAAVVVAPAFAGREIRIAWRAGRELGTGEEVWLPAAAVHCPASDGPWLGPAAVSWSSNGCAAHATREGAQVHALLEAIERDQLARALPKGWTADAVAERGLDPSSVVRRAPRTSALVRRIEEQGFEVVLFDVTPAEDAGGVGLPVAAALLLDRERGPVPLTAGYACRFRRDDALRAALLEAAQSRLTDVHGAREDVVAADPIGVEELRSAVRRWVRTRRVSVMPDQRPGRTADLVRLLRRAGHRRMAVVELSPEGSGVHACKVVVPSFLMTELL